MNRNRIGIFLLVLFFWGNTAFALTYPMPQKGDLVGQTFTVSAGSKDTLASIAHRYDMSVHEMLEANPHIKPNRYIGSGKKVIIPARFVLPKRKYRQKGGIVINLSELRLYYFTPDGHYVMTYPVAVGRRGWRTPTSSTSIIRKKEKPDWHPPESIRAYTYKRHGKTLPQVVPGGTPANPLGSYALYLGTPGILIHGTNNPASIGKYVSSGCIRLADRDIEELFYNANVGAKVNIINHSHKAGWDKGKLYLESHFPVALDEVASNLNHDSQERVINTALTYQTGKVDWSLVKRVATERNGIPQIVGTH